MFFYFFSLNVLANPLYGPAPDNGVSSGQLPNGGADLPQTPSGAVPSYNGPGFGAPNQQPQNGQPLSSTPAGGAPGQPTGNPPFVSSPPGGPAGSTQGNTSATPTFMNSAMPNQTNPFLPSVVSPGLISGPLEDAYLMNGVPQLAAPLMSAVYRPFGLTFFQPNPFQVVPQGSISLTGTFETDTNINFSPNQPEVGSLYTVTPAIMYSTFDDYGYLSFLANASYVGYDTGNISPYFDEMAGISAGTYLGTRLFVGAQDFFINGSTPQLNGQPFAFFNGINAFYENMADAEVGIALTPKVTFVQSAMDIYANDSNFGAGLMNLEMATDTLNYKDFSNFLTASYIYQQGLISLFPSFYSNGAMGTAMRQISHSTSIGVGGNISYYFYQNLPSLNFLMYSYYGILTHNFNRNFFISAQGGWNAIVYQQPGGLNYGSPMWDVNLGYTDGLLGLGINLGEFVTINNTYGVETGPENIYMALGYLNYQLGPKTTFYSSGGYTYYNFLSAPSYANNFFQTLQPSISYNGTYLEQTDGLMYRPASWVQTSLMYNLIDFTTNIPHETLIDNQFIAMVSFYWSFN